MKFRRRGLITNGALGILLLGGAGAVYQTLGPGDSTEQVTVRTFTASRGTVIASVSASGKVESARARSLNFGTSGTVEKIHVKPGDKVTAGQILAELDDDAAQESVASAAAGLKAAAEDSESSASAYAGYVKADITYKEAQRTLAATDLKAPFAGTVTAVNGTVGGSSASSASSGGGAGTAEAGGFIELADTRRLQLVGSFTESDVTKLKVGQTASISFDALTGVTGEGKITQIDPVAATSNNVVQYPVTVAFTDVPDEVRLGQTATVSVEVGKAENAIAVASTAITTAGGQSSVTVLRDGRQVRTPVTVGVQGTSLTEITAGLSEGDQIVPPASAATQNGNQRMGGFPGGGGGFPGNVAPPGGRGGQ
ncbi:membrane fusion protein, macrolide-specific efflux system [Sinosporangium album]|uniref:Membrane fusion protein, macrolide-specific efflux system n=1 Tax=Sinosporangium album TaxID=504805 RepID=A0A1G8HW15_9ACTN|nr:efflux RND transporter periplasmic adaptor subunit [Sinosporangium album]SDI10915.1 membrane fusion protein, macrolide-specific efflux system [Sinosporangium album]